MIRYDKSDKCCSVPALLLLGQLKGHQLLQSVLLPCHLRTYWWNLVDTLIDQAKRIQKVHAVHAVHAADSSHRSITQYHTSTIPPHIYFRHSTSPEAQRQAEDSKSLCHRCAIVVPSSASFFRRCQSTSFARRAAIPASTSVAFFRSSVSLSLTQQSSSKDVYLWLTYVSYVSYLHDSSCHFTLFHIKKQSKMPKGSQRQKAFRSNQVQPGPTLQASTIGFTRRSTNACIAQPRRHTTRATCHGPGHIVTWRLVLAGCGEQRSIKSGQSQIVRLKCCLCYLCYLICIWIQCCLVDSCESSICIHFHSIVCLFSNVSIFNRVQCRVHRRQTKKHTLWSSLKMPRILKESERVWKSLKGPSTPSGSKIQISRWIRYRSYRLNPPCGPGFEVVQISAARKNMCPKTCSFSSLAKSSSKEHTSRKVRNSKVPYLNKPMRCYSLESKPPLFFIILSASFTFQIPWRWASQLSLVTRSAERLSPFKMKAWSPWAHGKPMGSPWGTVIPWWESTRFNDSIINGESTRDTWGK